MNKDIKAEFTLLRYSAGDALHFVVENGAAARHDSGDRAAAATTTLPGLMKLVELQEKHLSEAKMHRYGSEDPLFVKRRTQNESHEQWCAHTQTACALAKNAVACILRQRTRIRIRRYGEALVQLAEASGNEDVDEGSTAVASDSAAASPNQPAPSNTSIAAAANAAAAEMSASKNNGGGGDSTHNNEGVAESDDEEEGVEAYLLEHPSFGGETATAWLQRRYLHCCDLVNVRPSVVVSQRLYQCVQPCYSGTVGSFFAAQKAASPLSPILENRIILASTMGRSWMTFPDMVGRLRERCAVPYEINPDLRGCVDIGKQARHFVAVMGLLEGCRNTVVSLNLSNTGLTDREVRVLCLFCHAHVRRLKVLDISGNRGITDRVAVRLKKLAASLPLLSRLSVQGTSLSPPVARAIERLLCRKML